MAKMTLTDALDRMNNLSLKNRTDKLSLEEQAEFDSLSHALEQFELPSAGKKTTPGLYNPTNNFKGPTGETFKTPNGGTIRAYTPTDRFQDEGTMEAGEFGDCIRSILIGADKQPRGFTKMIKNTTGTDPTGSSYMVPTILSKQLWDLARATSVAVAAGSTTIPLSGGNLTMVRTLTDVSPTFRSGVWEPVNVQNPSFNTATLSLKSVGALCAVSLEVLEDSLNAAQWIEQIMTRAVAAALDTSVFLGAVNGCTGIVNISGINEQASVGSLSDYSEHVTAISDCLTANSPDVSQL